MFDGLAEKVLGEVEFGSRKPPGTGHYAIIEYRYVALVGPDIKIVPEALPEGLGLGDRPLPELVVIAEGEPAVALQPQHIPPQIGLFGHLRGWLPEQLAFLYAMVYLHGRF